MEEIDRSGFMIPYELKLAPLPCWAGTFLAGPSVRLIPRSGGFVHQAQSDALPEDGERRLDPRQFRGVAGTEEAPHLFLVTSEPRRQLRLGDPSLPQGQAERRLCPGIGTTGRHPRGESFVPSSGMLNSIRPFRSG